MPFSAPVHASSEQSIHTSCIMSVVAPIQALPVPSVHHFDDKCQEFPMNSPVLCMGREKTSKITVNFPDGITLTLHQAKFLEKTPDTTKGIIYPGYLLST